MGPAVSVIVRYKHTHKHIDKQIDILLIYCKGLSYLIQLVLPFCHIYSKKRMQNNTVEFMKEYEMMQSIDHNNIVRLYGVVLDSETIMLITELAPLRSLLECLRVCILF